jgi:hypothetical protein
LSAEALAKAEAIHSSFAQHDGLLCGACHRARIHATRWLAMTGRAEQMPPANHGHLWLPNNNERYSVHGRNRNQLTLPENSAQIGTERIGFLRIFLSQRFFRE